SGRAVLTGSNGRAVQVHCAEDCRASPVVLRRERRVPRTGGTQALVRGLPLGRRTRRAGRHSALSARPRARRVSGQGGSASVGGRGRKVLQDGGHPPALLTRAREGWVISPLDLRAGTTAVFCLPPAAASETCALSPPRPEKIELSLREAVHSVP